MERGLKRCAASVLLTIVLGNLPIAASAQGLETVSPGEAMVIDDIRAHALAELKKRYPETQLAIVRRDAHAKAHGCVKAAFEVDADIPSDLRVGTFFTPGRRFKTLIRFSNGNFEPSPDAAGDGRGMAVKIVDADPVAKATSRGQAPHDILMINYPAFFSRDAQDYRIFANAGGLTGNRTALLSYFGLGFRIDGAMVAFAITRQEMRSPLVAQYYSMAPFLYSEGRAIKYSARSCPGSAQVQSAPAGDGPNYLRQALWAGLASAPACFELMVQERKGRMEIEDVVPVWSETQSPFRRIGRIEIPAGQTNSPQRDEACENLSFNPWNAPPEQRPLGGINRLRKAVYEAISEYRHRRNKSAPPEPAALWDDL
jgi:catalase